MCYSGFTQNSARAIDRGHLKDHFAPKIINLGAVVTSDEVHEDSKVEFMKRGKNVNKANRTSTMLRVCGFGFSRFWTTSGAIWILNFCQKSDYIISFQYSQSKKL